MYDAGFVRESAFTTFCGAQAIVFPPVYHPCMLPIYLEAFLNPG